MPYIQIDMLEGRSAEQIKKVVKDITEVMVNDANASADAVNIVVRESRKDHIAVGGVLKSEM
ncbi:2-hydroxymuconate tautomerase [Oenococcus kitaharae]|uniref:4-oxalocrotonate tautomerase n=1 Tax=Oenococcus kitaharae DSM 17330 TaxID=1045004 RepID=G9WGA8_9LACO|nr:2-hydroxymuconate tautomerase [Oenococcus kitaharae]EHN59716.1 4-oxalocrotonate tautomerase [Oenococcus kitaharae DSM 17330]MCV3295614.1 tautomerase family protein [Oenococcus kitaharae]OEY83546.1 4-oxalocrotonate tautomerase [Oenococcus kitaharae]OEY85345.1 4-oxalocrotonate tautomerase [Oenococcus kitaharae]